MKNLNIKKSIRGLLSFWLLFTAMTLSAQSITWGPVVPAISADNLQTCESSGKLIFSFTNSNIALTNPSIEIQLDAGINYLPGSFSFNSDAGAVVTEGDLSNLNRPQFNVSELKANEFLRLRIERVANCTAKDHKINGNSFRDSILVYENTNPVTYLGGTGTVDYDLTYAILSITNPVTSPSTTNIAGSAQRSLNITNGSFSAIQDFYFADVAPASAVSLDSFVINPNGSAIPIPSANVTIVGDSVIIHFDANLLMAIDGSEGYGNANTYFEKDEQFVLSYKLTPTLCGSNNTISSSLLVWWGCGYDARCQINKSGSSLGLTNGVPILNLSNPLLPALDFCDTVTYAVEITNSSTETAPAGGAFAKDLAIIIGLRANNSPIATPSQMTMWGTGYQGTKHFANIKINGKLVVPGTLTGIYGNPVDYIPANYFTTDPDGIGGLEDLDNDGFFDDLANDSSLVISFDLYLTPDDQSCGIGREDYIHWEHIAADISWENQCGIPMSPLRQTFNYTNFIRDYLTTTELQSPTDVVDEEEFTIGMKPYLLNSIGCNGGNGNTGSSVDWTVFVVLPPGISLAPTATYDPAYNSYSPSFTQSNDTVFYQLNRYVYDWYNFELQFDCDTWDLNDPIVIPFYTVYRCKDSSGNSCFEETVHCSNVSITPNCGTTCVGVKQTEFSALRTSSSWTDNTQSTLVNLNATDHELGLVYPKDTVQFVSTGILTDTMTNHLFLRITYSPEDTKDIFDFVGGQISITDKDGEYNGGQVTYQIPLAAAPTKNNLGSGNYEMIFDLSNYRQTVDPSFSYGQGPGGSSNYEADVVQVTADFVISSATTSINTNTVNNFRSNYYLLDQNGGTISCNSLGTNLSYTHSYFDGATGVEISEGCNTFSLPLYLSHKTNSGDNFPNEYRPNIHVDSLLVTIPTGWSIGEVLFYGDLLLAPSDYEVRPNGTLWIKRPSTYKDTDKIGTHYPRVTIDYIPSCSTAEGKSHVSYTVYYKKWTYINNPAVHERDSLSSSTSYLDYTAPSFALTPLNQSFSEPKDTAVWEVRICNSTSDMNVHYNWLTLDPTDGAVKVEALYDISSGTESAINYSSYDLNKTFVEIDQLNQGDCRDIRIYATYASCTNDTLAIQHGWACTGYPTPTESLGCGVTTEVYVLPQEAQISSTITLLADTPTDPANPANGNWGMTEITNCVPFPVEMQVVSAQPGNISNLSLDINIPSAGAGLVYISGSATIEVEGIDTINVPRAFGAAAEAAMINGSNNGSNKWTIHLADIDPTNFGNQEGLLGTTNVNQNEIILRWQFQSTCDLNSGDFYSVTTLGDQPCGGPAEGNGEMILSSPLDIDGITAPYFMNISSSLSPDANFESCDDLKTLTSTYVISSGSTASYDTLSYTLPTGLAYAGSFTCLTATCPSYLGTTTTNGKETILFKHPNNFNGTMTLSFEVTTNDISTCETNETIEVKSTSQVGAVACDTGVCPSLKIVTGSEIIATKIEKPDFEVQFIALNYTTVNTPVSYNYELDISNNGYQTEESVIVQFYCANGDGDDLEGMPIHADTITQNMMSHTTERLTGSFNASCDPNRGIVAIVTPGVASCYCGSLDNLAEKGAGLNELPHDLRPANFLPVELSSFQVQSEDCEMHLRWTTTSEKNNAFFEVQRSNDGKKFQTLSAFPGQGNSNSETHYDYLDTEWRGEQASYYRLKQIDLDGQFSFSDVVAAEWSNCYAPNTISNVYPNPVRQNDFLHIEFLKEDQSDIILTMTDLLGQTIQTFNIENAPQGSNAFKLSTKDIPSGTYFISIQSVDNQWRSAMHKVNVVRD